MSTGRMVASIMKWFFIGIVPLVSLPFVLVGSSYIYEKLNTYKHSYRLTIEVETPEGIKTGSSVIQVSITPHMIHWNPSAVGATTTVKAEAVFIDLGNGRNVIATLGFGPTGANTDKLSDLAAYAFGRNKAFWYKQAPSWKGQAELHGDLIPTLVTFANPADPSTLRVVKPDEFEAVFGPGYRFKGACIEMTKDSVTRVGIEEKLPWLKDLKNLNRMSLYKIYKNIIHFHEGLFVRNI